MNLRPRLRPRCAWLAAFAAALLPAQQPPASDEIRVSSQPYLAQTPSTFHAETRLVDIGVAVRDSHGRAIAGLTRDNFRIFDEGQPREIAAFSEHRVGGESAPGQPAPAAAPVPTAPESAAPGNAPAHDATPPKRFLAFFFDDVNEAYGKEAADVQRAQAAAVKFIRTSLRPGIEVGVFTASGAPALDFTADPQRIEDAIGAVKVHPQFAEKICSGMNPYQAYRIWVREDRETLRLVMVAAAKMRCSGTPDYFRLQAQQVWDRVKATSTQTFASVSRLVSYMESKPGERVLVLASSGFVGETMEIEQDRLIDQAVRAGVVINSLVTKGLYNELRPDERFDDDPQPQKAIYTVLPGHQQWAKAEEAEVEERPMVMDEAMANLARGTGGVLFHNNNDLNAGFRETSAGPEVTYRMSFNPEGAVFDGSFHRLQVKLVHAGSYSLEARPGYFAPDELGDEKQRANLDKEVMASDLLAGLAAGVGLRMEKRADGQRAVQVIAHVDISKLTFARRNDRQNQRITVVAAFFDPQGKLVTAKEGRMDLSLKSETFDRLESTGVNAELTFLMPPGVYKLRAVVGEGVKGDMAASTYPLEVK